MDARQVGGRFYKVVNVLTHGQYAVGQTDDCLDEARCEVVREYFRGGVGRFEVELHGFLRRGILVLEVCGEQIEQNAHVLLLRHGHTTYGATVARDGIVQTSALHVGELHVTLLHQAQQDAEQEQVGIGTLLLDVVTGVTSHQTFHRQAEEVAAFGSVLPCNVERRVRVGTAGTADENLSFVFRVQIQQVFTRHEAGSDA